MAKKLNAIPADVKLRAEEVIRAFNAKQRNSKYVARFKGRFLLLDRSDFGEPAAPICCLEFTGDFEGWRFGIYRYSSGAYDFEEDMFAGSGGLDGGLVNAMKTGLKAYAL